MKKEIVFKKIIFGKGFRKIYFKISTDVINFLQEKKAYDNFLYNAKLFRLNGDVIDNIDEGFIFSKTKEGQDYWDELFIEFNKFDNTFIRIRKKEFLHGF